jgi:ribosomal protein RSM22 (predicted rRNA methylase)
MTGARKSPKDELKALAADVLRLSRLLTKERGGLGAAYLRDEGLRRAYVRYFLPANRYKIHIPLAELSLHAKNLLSKERLRVLDIGAGPGTSLLGVMEFFGRQAQRPSLEFVAVDEVFENLREAEALFQEYRNGHYRPEASLHIVKATAERLEHHLEGEFDIIVLSNVLNELFPGDAEKTAKRAEFLKNVLDRRLGPDGSCIIIEPALRETSREMAEVVCKLLAEGFTIYAPCPERAFRAVLENPRDWYHEDVPWDPPALIKEIDELIGLRKDSLKFSYAVLRKDGLSLTDVHGLDSCRIVSEPLVSKGKIEFYVCSPAGRLRVTRLDKDRTPQNASFEDLRRGDIVRFDRPIREEKRLKAGKDTGVVLLYTCSV